MSRFVAGAPQPAPTPVAPPPFSLFGGPGGDGPGEEVTERVAEDPMGWEVDDGDQVAGDPSCGKIPDSLNAAITPTATEHTAMPST